MCNVCGCTRIERFKKPKLKMIVFTIFAIAEACSLISGVWINELGSTATLKATQNGDLIGTYNSAVGKASGNYELRGRYDKKCDNPTLSFSVTWTNANETADSSTAWVGTLFDNIDTIYTTWLLVSTVNSTLDQWAATRIGTNVFTRK